MCGEQKRHITHQCHAAGSSPRVRGTDAGPCAALWQFRFIPACAGNSSIPRSRRVCAPVHPRVCGEQGGDMADPDVTPGSSPRVRGTAGDLFRLAVLARFIPACAGNSIQHQDSPPQLPVHPRVCGEQRAAIGSPSASAGSSPRVRGTAAPAVSGRAGHRFIPACAGNRAHRAIPVSLNAVHPRVCGEQC